LYTQEGNKFSGKSTAKRNQNNLSKPQRGDINKARGNALGFEPQRGDINKAWGSAPGNPNYGHVEYSRRFIAYRVAKATTTNGKSVD